MIAQLRAQSSQSDAGMVGRARQVLGSPGGGELRACLWQHGVCAALTELEEAVHYSLALSLYNGTPSRRAQHAMPVDQSLSHLVQSAWEWLSASRCWSLEAVEHSVPTEVKLQAVVTSAYHKVPSALPQAAGDQHASQEAR